MMPDFEMLLCSDQHFPFKYFPNFALAWKISLVKISRYLLAAVSINGLMLSSLSSKAQGRKDFWKPSKPCYVGIHWKFLTEYCQMSTNFSRFQSFFRIFASFFPIGQIATSSIRVNGWYLNQWSIGSVTREIPSPVSRGVRGWTVCVCEHCRITSSHVFTIPTLSKVGRSGVVRCGM